MSSEHDRLLEQATCKILIGNKVVGTAWLVKPGGILLTAGHIVGKDEYSERVEVQFLDDDPRTAVVLYWLYQPETGDDFAVLKVLNPPEGREPLPINTDVLEATGGFTVRGFGKSLVEMSSGKGIFTGKYFPMNSEKNALFQLSSKELGEQGYSGAAVFSEVHKAAIAIQIEATLAQVGAQRDTLLAMPLYRISQIWDFDASQPNIPLNNLRIVLGGNPEEFTSRRRALFLDVFIDLFHLTWDKIRLLAIDKKNFILTLQLPEETKKQILTSQRKELYQTIEQAFVNKAKIEEVEPSYLRIIKIIGEEEILPPYPLEFVNRDEELQYILNSGSPRYIEICAAAGKGKTYLLERLETKIQNDRRIVVRIDFDTEDAPSNGVDFLKNIASKVGDLNVADCDQLSRLIFRKNLQVYILLDNTESMSPELKSWIVKELIPHLEARIPWNSSTRIIAAGRKRVNEWHMIGNPRFSSLDLTPFNEAIIQDAITKQVERRKDIETSLRHLYRDWSLEILALSKGHPKCISRLIQWMDAQDFAVTKENLQKNRKELFYERIQPVIEEDILGHLADKEFVELIYFFSIPRGYNSNIVFWLVNVALNWNIAPPSLMNSLGNAIDSLETLKRFNSTQLSDGLPSRGMYQFDNMLRQLLSLKFELERPELFIQIHRWAAEMYDYWIEGLNHPGVKLPNPPHDETQALYMVESVFHHMQIVRNNRDNFQKVGQFISGIIQHHCRHSKSTTGWRGQTIQQFIAMMSDDDEINNLFELFLEPGELNAIIQATYRELEVIGKEGEQNDGN